MKLLFPQSVAVMSPQGDLRGAQRCGLHSCRDAERSRSHGISRSDRDVGREPPPDGLHRGIHCASTQRLPTKSESLTSSRESGSSTPAGPTDRIADPASHRRTVAQWLGVDGKQYINCPKSRALLNQIEARTDPSWFKSCLLHHRVSQGADLVNLNCNGVSRLEKHGRLPREAHAVRRAREDDRTRQKCRAPA